MNQAEARHILNLCKTHNLPRPRRENARAGEGVYQLVWKTQRLQVAYIDFDASVHFCRSMFEERRRGGRTL
ncbi:MAG: hypothetical protein R2834_02645 [Rhodothermales bacterium]